jgi:putative spermidine/putrescine transport system permease protein
MSATTLDKPTSTPELATPKKRRRGGGFGLDKIVLLLVVIYFVVPLITTLIFALSDGNHFSMNGLNGVFTDPDFTQSLLLSLELAVASTLLTILLVTPTAYWVQMRLPQARVLMDTLALVPFAVPAIVMAFGLIEIYTSATPLVNVLSLGLVPFLSNVVNVYDTPQLLICGYVIIALPFVYRPLDNNLRAINTRVLSEASFSLGSGWWRTFLTVILPNIWPGVISASLLTFSTAMGEFTLASMFGLETFPVYLNVTGQNDAHKAAALTILSFLLTLLCMLGILLLPRLFRQRGAADKQTTLVAAK